MLVLDGEHPVTSLTFTPDGTRLVVARARGHPLTIWAPEVRTLATGECLSLPKPEGATDLAHAVHPSGRVAFFAYGCALWAVSLADGTSWEVPGTGSAAGVIVSPDGKWVVVANRMNGTPIFYGFRCDVDKRPVCAVGWGADSQIPDERLAGFVGNGDRFVTVGCRRIVVRDTETGAVRSTVRFPSPYSARSVTSPDGGRLAVQSGTQFYLWNTVTWAKSAQIATEGRPLIEYTFHPTRPIIAAIQNRQTLVKFLSADTGEVVSKFRWKLGEMWSACFSPDGTLAAAGSVGGQIVVWDVD